MRFRVITQKLMFLIYDACLDRQLPPSPRMKSNHHEGNKKKRIKRRRKLFQFFTFFTGQFLHNNSKFLHCLVLIPFFHLFTDNKTKACSQAREKISRTDNNFRGWGRFTHRRTLPHSDAASLTIVLRSAELEIEIDSYQQLFLKLPNSSVVKSSET